MRKQRQGCLFIYFFDLEPQAIINLNCVFIIYLFNCDITISRPEGLGLHRSTLSLCAFARFSRSLPTAYRILLLQSLRAPCYSVYLSVHNLYILLQKHKQDANIKWIKLPSNLPIRALRTDCCHPFTLLQLRFTVTKGFECTFRVYDRVRNLRVVPSLIKALFASFF